MTRLLLALAALLLALTGCSSDTADDPTGTEPAAASGAQVAAAVDAGATVLDVRTPEEFAAGHVEGATNLDVSATDFDDRLAGLDPAATYVVYCRSGSRSAAAAERMRTAGFTDVVDGGGLEDMEAAGFAPTAID